MQRSHARKRNRLKDYDYSTPNYYFVTICTKDMTEYFGHVENDRMILNEFGEIVKQQWLWLAERYDYVELDEFIVMPNHVHGIIIIEPKYPYPDTRCDNVGTGHDLSLQKIKSLSSIVGVFKTTSSKQIHLAGLSLFAWQRSFHDYIIRNEKSLQNIRCYIRSNPARWIKT